MDGTEEAIRRTGQEDAIRRDETDVEAHRFRGGIAPDDAPDGEAVIRGKAAVPDEADVEGHGIRPKI